MIDRILDLIENRSMSCRDIGIELHSTRANIHLYIKHLRGDDGALKRIYVDSYDISPIGKRTARYKAGNLPDVPEPPRLTAAQYRQRIKSDPERRARDLKKRKARRLVAATAASAKKSTAPWARALGL